MAGGGSSTPRIPNRSSFLTGQKDVTVAGTAEQLTATSIPILDGYLLTIVAKPGNNGIIYYGNSKANAEGGDKFDGLDAGLADSLRVSNVNLVWVNSSVSGDGVSWRVEQ